MVAAKEGESVVVVLVLAMLDGVVVPVLTGLRDTGELYMVNFLEVDVRPMT
jgi:hypothetical protein